ncbi:RNA-binding protein 48 [Microcaecilia unicolor]|uniref:RNA-binding protein 48 n=1 Tax=Microcaecilia unicolor TaxID=1415580 RepID=A0A6P7XZT2_9AMPH|nr:RNA-binding protein 48 [Microcaecilia unicolor]
MAMAVQAAELAQLSHHEQRQLCYTRPKYREGRRPRAVKVYTVNLESRYLLVQGVPAVGVMKELIEHFALYGAIEEYHALDEYPAEQFTEVYLIKFQRLQSARVAKRKLDERSFFGGLLHVCYAPEFETVQETREKLQERRKFIAKATSKREWLVTEKTQDLDQNPTASEYSEHSSQPGRSDGSISRETPYSCFTHPFDLPSSCSVPQNTVTAIPACVGNWPPESSADNSQAASTADIDQCREHDMIASTPGPQRKEPSDKGIGRFIPRTTLLEERKRRRDQEAAFHLTGTSMDSTEVIVGPMLPEIPNVDMDDESLNVSANAIRNKLKEVSSIPVLKSERAEVENTQRAPPPKQRRRI